MSGIPKDTYVLNTVLICFYTIGAAAIAEESHFSFSRYQLLEQEDALTRRCKNSDRANEGMPREMVKHLWLDKGITF